MNERFTYRGSATVGGVQLPNVELQEKAVESGLQAWEGSARFAMTRAPDGFPGSLDINGRVLIELADGRRGEVFATNVEFDGTHWSVDLLGNGPV
ncbi:hypothetical protein [Streptomyces murinus]